MTRRLLGYVVKLPDGTRFSGTPKPCSRDEAESFGDDIEGWVVPVFSKPKPAEPAHPYGCARCYGFGHVWDGTVQVPCMVCRDAKPALVVSAEPDAYLIEMENGGWQVARSFCGSLEDGETLVPLYRHPPEAALMAAREEGRREDAEALTTCRARLEHWLDLWSHRVRAPEYPGDEVASGAKIEAYEQAILTIDEAAKGAAK